MYDHDYNLIVAGPLEQQHGACRDETESTIWTFKNHLLSGCWKVG